MVFPASQWYVALGVCRSSSMTTNDGGAVGYMALFTNVVPRSFGRYIKGENALANCETFTKLVGHGH
jgi:hypothetical protein